MIELKEKPCVGIYKITNPKGKIYIGQSRNIKKRFSSYKSINCKYQTKLKYSLLKYGPDAHFFEIIELCQIIELNIKERHWQEFYNCINIDFGMNLILTETLEKPRVISEETRKKISKGGLNRFTSEETKQKIRESKKNLSAETRLKLSLCNKGKTKSDEHRKKLNIAKTGSKGAVWSSEQKTAQSKLRLGSKMTTEQIEKMAVTKRKIILNSVTGIYYFGISDAASSMYISKGKLAEMLLGRVKNKTQLYYV